LYVYLNMPWWYWYHRARVTIDGLLSTQCLWLALRASMSTGVYAHVCVDVSFYIHQTTPPPLPPSPMPSCTYMESTRCEIKKYVTAVTRYARSVFAFTNNICQCALTDMSRTSGSASIRHTYAAVWAAVWRLGQ